jgi:hypothetical protein
MPTQDIGRKKVKDFLEKNNISITSLAVSYGMTRAEMSSYVNGTVINAKSNKTILKIIEDLNIR